MVRLVDPDLVVDVKDSLLDFVVDFSSSVDKCFLDVGRSLCRGLHENQAVLAGKSLALLPFHVSPGFQIATKKRTEKLVWIMKNNLASFEAARAKLFFFPGPFL